METILSLLEDGIRVTLEDFSRDLFATVGGQAVEDMSLGRGCCNDAVIDLITGKLGGPVLGLFFLPHADPDIGVEDVGAESSLLGIIGDGHRASGSFCTRDEFGGWAVELGAGKAQLESEPCRGPDPRVAHVAVGITNEGDLESIQRPAKLFNREQVGENLAGMLLVGKGIDGRDA